MSYIQVEFYSQSLKRAVSFGVCMPDDIGEEMKAGNPHYQRERKTIYLLHGYCGGYRDWLIDSRIRALSIQYNLNVICPSGENSFYLDKPGTGFAYGEYVGSELVSYTRRLFGLSDKREDTYIGGLSMGGFGALRNGLKYHETFSKIIALSSALIIHEIKGADESLSNAAADYHYYRHTFGDLNTLEDSDRNPEYLISTLIKQKAEIPEIYMACGTEDFLLQNNRGFKDFLVQNNVSVTYKEEEGIHDWKFWDKYVEEGFKWAMDK